MKNKIIYLVLLLLLSTTTTSILAQEQCGTELTQAQIDYMNAKREARKNLTSTEEDCSEYENITEVITIPMVAHIIRDDEGNGGLSTADLSIGMVNLNRAFEQVGFEFELCKINYIDNTAYTAIEYPQSTSDQYTSEEYIMATENRVAGKVNVFFIEDIGNYCGWSSFPSYVEAYDRDWTIMKNTCTTGSILAHELGHWFNLYHTHERGLTEAELVERPSEDGNDNSNCGPGVGDELCDTPADHNLYNCVNSYNCTYQCNFQDDNGDTYTPDETNIMSYSLPKCMTFFSPCQIKRMHESYLTDRSSSLCPCTGSFGCETTSLDCEITAISVSNTSACDSDGYFTGDVTVNYLGRPDDRELYLTVTEGASDINTAEFFGYGHTFTGVNIPANANQAVSMTAIFSGEPSCRFTDDVYTGRDCGPCIISALDVSPAYCNDNDTPYDATDDFFNPMIEVYYEEHPASGNLIIEGNGVNETVPVSELSYDDGYYRFYDIFFPANGMGGSIKAKFSAESSCFKEVSFGGTPACSVDGICDAENATITQPVRGTYVKEVNNTITAENKIYNYDINGRGTEATYKAGQKIILESGFHAHNGSKFHAFIGSCTTSNKEEITNNEPISLRNYPNPFTGQTTIEFKLTKDTPVTLFVSDVTGRQIAVLLNNDEKTEGTHSVIFDGNNYPAGMYYYTIQAGEYYGTQKMVLAK